MNKTGQFHDLQYMMLLRDILGNGHHKGDRTGTGTTSIFARDMVFDLSDGSIPILTNKKIHLPSIVHELLWYISGSSNVKYLQDNGVRIWNEWSTPRGHLGPVYGQLWRNYPTAGMAVTEVKKRTVEELELATEIQFLPRGITYQPDPNDELILSIHTSNSDVDYKICERVDNDAHGNINYRIEFVDTSYSYIVTKQSAISGSVKDPYQATAAAHGFLGERDNPCSYRRRAHDIWSSMISRCYDKDHEQYPMCGGAGVFVERTWLNFSNFLEDLPTIINFDAWYNNEGEYQLDKDYYCGNGYSKGTCIFIPNQYHQALVHLTGDKYTATNVDTGQVEEFTNVTEYANNHGYPIQSVHAAIVESKDRRYKDLQFDVIKPNDGCVYRKQYTVDQLGDVIERIKTNPNCRRLIVNCWKPDALPDTNKSFSENVANGKQALPPCHYSFQFYVANGTLSLKLTQRSADAFLGIPFNIAQYSLLLHMVAKLTNLKPGEFIWSGGDIHIYDNHINQVNELLGRDPYQSPTIGEFPEYTSIDNFKYEDFVINDYEFHSAIKAKVAI